MEACWVDAINVAVGRGPADCCLGSMPWCLFVQMTRCLELIEFNKNHCISSENRQTVDLGQAASNPTTVSCFPAAPFSMVAKSKAQGVAARKPKRSAEQMMEEYDNTAQKLAERANAKRVKGRLLFINHVCKSHDWVIPHVVKTLKNCGFAEGRPVRTQSATKKKKKPTEEELESVDDDDNDDSDDDSDGDDKQPEEDDEEIPEGKHSYIDLKFNAIGDIAPDLMTVILAQIAPIALSKNNLRELLESKRARYIKKEPLMQIYERLTGVLPGTLLNKELRVVDRFVARSVELHEALGSPGDRLRMPPKWQRDGFYHKVVRNSKTFLTCPSFPDMIPAELNADDFPKEDFDDIHIENNFSLRLASVVNTGTGASVAVLTLWPDKLMKVLSVQKLVIGGTKTIKSRVTSKSSPLKPAKEDDATELPPETTSTAQSSTNVSDESVKPEEPAEAQQPPPNIDDGEKEQDERSAKIPSHIVKRRKSEK